MGRLFFINLEGNLYSCKHCNTHFALSHHIISKELNYPRMEMKYWK
ncbi:hypothetical protein Lalb_Chr14g0372411 [Lupinus albus]|uniref:Yippee domain-containing protein n=1 Tax=Lupinus albus TaxID=3870 RepID=A0A6A4PFW6_LUPAL|nr:hypothetical protein Lalb_Chr14g0372411 [Lupinus albus]